MDSLPRTHLLGLGLGLGSELGLVVWDDFVVWIRTTSVLSHTHSVLFFFSFSLFLSQTSSILPPPNSTRTHSLSHRLKISLFPFFLFSFSSSSSSSEQHTLPHFLKFTTALHFFKSTSFKLAFQNQTITVREIKPKNRRIMVTQSPTFTQLMLSCIFPPLSHCFLLVL